MKIIKGDIHLVDLRTRLPFQYGIATMIEVPQAFIRIEIDCDGDRVSGIAADLLPPKWFTKNPTQPLREEIQQMLRVIQQALEISRNLEAPTPFDLWQSLYRAQLEWGARNQIPPLLANFGCSLVERALVEAFGRWRGRPFARLVRANDLGVRLESFHPALRGTSPADLLPAAPLDRIVVRHTVGLADPLRDDDIPARERLADGLPQSLEACIRAYRLRHFKIKLRGQAEPDLERLRRIARVLGTAGEYACSLDGNEQFKALGDFRGFWEQWSGLADLEPLRRRLLFVEQPLHRDVALSPAVGREFADWPGHPPVIIDESDGRLEDLPAALELGYAGTSHKNCKGLFKGLAHACLLAQLQRTHAAGPLLLTGEDLCNVGPVALLQDLAVMAAFGISSVERNGHHYLAGLSQFPKGVQQQVLSAHPDLYQTSSQGWPTLRIEDGCVRVASLNRHPLGPGFVLDVEQFTPLDQWNLDRY